MDTPMDSPKDTLTDASTDIPTDISMDIPMDTGAPVAVVRPRHGRRRASGALEGEVLAVLQQAAGPLTPREVQSGLAGELTYSTVVTILSRLHGKEVLSRTPRGRAYAYAPVADEAGLAARRMRKVLDGSADREAVLTRFVSELPPSDAAVLRSLFTSAFPPAR